MTHLFNLTDSNILRAADLWVTDSLSATALYGAVDTWDLSQVTSLEGVWCGYDDDPDYCGGAYEEKQLFNDDISKWDTSKVISMVDTFDRARSFNGDISNWDVSKVYDMSYSKSIHIFENDLT